MVAMNICVKCDEEFPIKVEINGKIRNLQRRKYCLDCSPFKSGNTKKLHKLPEKLVCITCGKQLRGNQTKFCSGAFKVKEHQGYEEQKLRGIKRKAYLVMQAGGECQKCGYKSNLSVLHFDHRNPEEKGFELDMRTLSTRTFASIIEEFAKCDLLCANCHMQEHYPDFEDWKTAYSSEDWSNVEGY